jgi:DNA-binding NarL/FixJ family response regulator
MHLSVPQGPYRTVHRQLKGLTGSEKQLLEMIWDGLTNREMARRLTISVNTVEGRRATIMKKMRVRNTAELLKAAIQQKLVKLA